MPQLQNSIASTEDVAKLSMPDRKSLALAAMNQLGQADRADVQNQVGLGSPGRRTTNWIWKVVVGTLCAVALAAAGALVASALLKIEAPTILTVFTTTAGFLVGLMSPSPAAANEGRPTT